VFEYAVENEDVKDLITAMQDRGVAEVASRLGQDGLEFSDFAIAGALKLFLMRLPDPVIPYEYHEKVLFLSGRVIDLILIRLTLRLELENQYIKESCFQTLVHTLPPAHRRLLSYILVFLHKIVCTSTNTQILQRLSKLLTPILMPPQIRK